MTKLPRQLKPREVISALERLGFRKIGTKGSHIHFRHMDGRWTQVAFHTKPIPQGTLRTILRQTKLTVETLLENL